MPELAEVETLKRYLEKHIIDFRVDKFVQYRKNLRHILDANLADKINDATIKKLERRAKYLLIHLSNSNVMIVHLGMSGRFTTQNIDYIPTKHDHIEIYISRPPYENKLIFNDVRRFGMFYCMHESEISKHKIMQNIGPEPLEDEFNAEYLRKKLKGKKQAIKNSLMDNRVVVGVGNIYAAESLFMTKIHPERPSGNLKKTELDLLTKSIKEVLKKAIEAGGTTLKDFVSGDSSPGYFKQELNVYGRDALPCNICGSLIEKIKQAGRGTFLCPRCQK